MPDQRLTCATCRQPFTWTVGEQRFFRERGLQAPRRCPDCRKVARQQTAAAPAVSRPAGQPMRHQLRGRTPRQRFGIAALVAAVGLSVVLFLIVGSTPLLAWLLAVNLLALLAYGYDKAIAGGTATRVPEAVLLGLALIGGSPGAFVAMLLFRHKTSKPAFLLPFALVVGLQVVLLVAWQFVGQRL